MEDNNNILISCSLIVKHDAGLQRLKCVCLFTLYAHTKIVENSFVSFGPVGLYIILFNLCIERYLTYLITVEVEISEPN